MKILAPLRHSEEVLPLIEAGADEFFCGLTPATWDALFQGYWANRRSPASAGVADLDEFRRILERAGARPVYVALNAPSYPPGGVELLARFGAELLEAGAAGLIVADLELLLALAPFGPGRLHLSSLATSLNRESAEFFRSLGVGRIILPRHLTLPEIEAVRVAGLEIEVFLLNHGCVFEEGLCSTSHSAGPFCTKDGEGESGLSERTRERYAFWKWTLNHCGCRTGKECYPVGPCGLCALPRFLAAGVASCKVVGREASLARKEASVRLAARALALAREGAGVERIRSAVAGMRGGEELCRERHLCYYPDVWSDR